MDGVTCPRLAWSAAPSLWCVGWVLHQPAIDCHCEATPMGGVDFQRFIEFWWILPFFFVLKFMNFAGFLRLFGGYLYVGILHPTACFNLSTKPGPWGYQRRLFHNWGSFQGLVPLVPGIFNMAGTFPATFVTWVALEETMNSGAGPLAGGHYCKVHSVPWPLGHCGRLAGQAFLEYRYRFRSYARMNMCI